MTKEDKIVRLQNDIVNIETLLLQDETDGYVLRPSVRDSWENKLDSLQAEYDELINEK